MHEPTFTSRQEALLAALGAAIRRAPAVPNFLVDDERTSGAELLLLHPGFEHGAMVADSGDVRMLIGENLLAFPGVARDVALVTLTAQGMAYARAADG